MSREADGPLLLAVETSGPEGSVALGRGGGVLEEVVLGSGTRHAARMVLALDELLERSGVARGDLEGIVVGSGPGSFTGVRVAAATAKGLSHALDVPLRAVSSLEAAAVADASSADAAVAAGAAAVADASAARERYVLFDARGDRLYAGCYRLPPGGLEVVRAPRATRLATILTESWGAESRFVGGGALRHRAAIESAGGVVLPPPAGVPTARGLLRALALRPGAPPLDDPFGWEPDYLRASGAERARR